MRAATVKGSLGSGTGTLVGSDLVLTSAHVIYSQENQLEASSITFFPGKSGPITPYGCAKVIDFYYPNAYKSDPYPSDNDWVILKLDRKIGDITGWLELKYFDNNDLRRVIHTVGYPGETLDEMYSCTGSITCIGNGLIAHNMDTTSGQSGSGIWHEISNNKYLLAIHQGGLDNRNNIATLWTDSKHQEYLNFLRKFGSINAVSPSVNSNNELPEDFNSSTYLSLNPDLLQAVATGTPEQQDSYAKFHYTKHGRGEGRKYR